MVGEYGIEVVPGSSYMLFVDQRERRLALDPSCRFVEYEGRLQRAGQDVITIDLGMQGFRGSEVLDVTRLLRDQVPMRLAALERTITNAGATLEVRWVCDAPTMIQ